MARKAEPGISYFPMKVDHIMNSKLRLLINDCDATGYWVWNCMLGKIYGKKGYYMDLNDEDELEYFSTEVCKRELAVVRNVIDVCIRRKLFHEGLFTDFKILTSDHIQEVYLEATAERRRKGTPVILEKDFLLIPEQSDEKDGKM